MSRQNLLLGVLLLAGLSHGCDRSKEVVQPTRATRRALEAAAKPAKPSAPRSPLVERLELEATAHPDSRRQVEEALALLAELSIPLVRTRQVLAEPLGADYCANALSEAGLGFSLCAFAEPSAAEQGQQRSQSTFDRLIPNRQFVLTGRTLLTLLPAQTEAARGESERVLTRFARLCEMRLASR